MKKAGIVSCYFQPNYGSMLQAYATQMALDKMGYDNETIDITGFNGEIRKAKIRYFAKASLTSGILLTKMGRAKDTLIRRLSRSEYTQKAAVRNQQFRKFSQKYFRLSKVYPSKSVLGAECEQNYSAVLVGSDQLWLPGNIAADYYTLNFVPESVNTIAYATSFGQSSLPKDSAKLAKVFLQKIRHIAVREESGQKLVEELTQRKVPVVCDPTLLFTGEEWLSVQEQQPLEKGEYIFCYFLGTNPLHREFVRKLKAQTGYKVIILPHIDEYVKADEECSDKQLYDVDPSAFLNLIRHAKYVCTDSFHCSVFSILYKKEFFTFRRFSDKNKQSTNSRLDTLFHITGITGRLISGDEDISEVTARKTDFAMAHQKLAEIRQKSYDYLETALKDCGGTDL